MVCTLSTIVSMLAMKKMSKKIILTIFTFFIFGVSYYFLAKISEKIKFEYTSIQKHNVIQEVLVTGKVTTQLNVELSFEKSAKIRGVYVKTGDRVKKNQLLVDQQYSELSADYRRAQAQLTNSLAILSQYESSLNIQEIRLEELKKGTRPEEIDIKKTELLNDEQKLIDIYTYTHNILQNAYNLSDTAVRAKTSGMFYGSSSSFYTLTFQSCDKAGESKTENLRLQSEKELDQWKNELLLISTASAENLEQELDNSSRRFFTFQNFLQQLNYILTLGCVMNNSSLDNYRVIVAQARNEIISAQSSINSHKESIRSKKLTINLVKKELAFKMAPPTQEQIAFQEANIRQAEATVRAQESLIEQARANIQGVYAQIVKTKIRSPFDGIITKQDAKVGEIASANTQLISIISDSPLQIQSNVPEVDFAKIHKGNIGAVTLDAYGNDLIFNVRVISIDPSAIVIESVPTYKITLEFLKDDPRVKEGMTANIALITDKKESVLAIVQKAIVVKDNKKIVRVLPPDFSTEKKFEYEERGVKTGLKGSNGYIEITQGIQEGEKVITFLEEK